MQRLPMRDIAPPIPSSKAPAGKTWLLSLDQIESNTGCIMDSVIAEASSAGSSTFAFDQRHVLYSKLRPYLNKVICPEKSGIATTELVPLLPVPNLVHKRYLMHYLRSPTFVEWASRNVSGAKMPRVVMSSFWKHRVPIPPLEEQRRIADILDRADAIRRKRQQASQLAADFLPSLFLEWFGDPVTNPKNWPKIMIHKIVGKIDSGWSPSIPDKPANPGEWCVLKLGAVTSQVFKPEENKQLTEDFNPKPRIAVSDGDVLFSRKNTRELVAASALVIDPPQRVMMSDLIFRLRPVPESGCTPEFLWGVLSYAGFRTMVTRPLAGGSAGSMPNISKANLLQVEVPFPPTDRQAAFAGMVRRHHKRAATFASGLEAAERLASSLSHQFFGVG